jgi:hypothetical protein
VTAWEELRDDGHFGDEASLLLYRCVRTVARFGGYPPPQGSQMWDMDAVQSVAHAVFAAGRGPARLVELAIRASSEAEFTRVLEAVVRNHLRDLARDTTKGKLIRRLRHVLDSDDRFATVPDGAEGAGFVTLADGTLSGVFGGRHDDLVAASYGAPGVTLLRWRADTRREPPVADRDSLVSVCETVLRAAGAAMRLPDLAQVVADRFAVGAAPLGAGRDTEPWHAAHEPDWEPGTPASTGSAGAAMPADRAVIVEEAARSLISQLDLRERLVLGHLAAPTVRDMAEATGIPRSTVAGIATSLRSRLSVALSDATLAEDDLAEAVLSRAMALALRPA